MAKRDRETTSKIMSSIPSRDTRPELAVRRALWHLGFRFRVDYDKLPGRPDIVFLSAKLAVFIDGDFWHGNAWRVRGKASLADLFPTNTDWWVAKIEGNMERDREVTEILHSRGWKVLRFWESTVTKDLEALVTSITEELGSASSQESG